MVYHTTSAYLKHHAKKISLADIDAHFSIITPHSVLATRVYHYWRGQQEGTCLAPECLSLPQWLGQQYRLSMAQSKNVMSYSEQLKLWLHVLKRQHPEYSYLHRLHLAKSYYTNWRQTQLNNTVHTDDMYLAALAQYHEDCQQSALVDSFSLLKDFACWYKGNHRVVLHGFGWLNTATEKFIQALGSHVYYLESHLNTPMRYHCYRDISEEMHATCTQITQLQSQFPQRVHAVVVCESSYVAPMHDMLNQFCYPHSYHAVATNNPVYSSSPTMLVHSSLVKALFCLIDFVRHPDASKLRGLLSHTYFQHPAISRSLYDTICRIPVADCASDTAFVAKVDALLALESQQPLLFQQFVTLTSHDTPPTLSSGFTHWIIALIQRSVVGLLSEEECSIMAQWQQICHDAAVDQASSDDFDVSFWLENLTMYLEHTPLRASDTGATVYLGTWDDSLAVPCDYLWTIGAHAAVWPGTNPFVSGLPTSRDTLCASIAYHQHQCRVQSTISYPASDHQGQALLPSPYITQDFYQPEVDCARHPLLSDYALESITDDQGPCVSDTERSVGSQAIRLYSHCPCTGFLHKRLHITKWQTESIGFSASDIGTVTHAALARWFKPHQPADEAQVLRWVEQYVSHSDWSWQPTVLQKSTLAEHVSRTVNQWLSRSLELHEDEPLFQSKAEVKIQYPLGPISMELRADRIDYFADKQRIVDYKTATATRSMWDGERMHDPQLPLYTLSSKDVQAVTFCSLHPQQWGYSGISAQQEPLKGLVTVDKWLKDPSLQWPDQVQKWQDKLTALATQYAEGLATVSPKDTQVCQQCQLENICRKMSARSATID